MAEEANFKDFKISDLMKKVENKFLLTAGIARRARQLKDGAKPFVTVDHEILLPVVTALHELHQDKLSIVLQEEKDETAEMLEKMDEELDTELEADELAEKEAEKEAAKAKKDKDSKKKSRSLAA